jgi:polyisoprenoid-binding protein YceI
MQKRIESGRYPTIDGVLERMELLTDDGMYQVTGDVTFKGVKRPHQDKMTIDPVDDQTIRLAGKSQFDLREFGMEPPRMLLLKVYPEVEVRVEIVAAKEA